jgi:16S rRNA (uracil1498-N3)-methyltransferase
MHRFFLTPDGSEGAPLQPGQMVSLQLLHRQLYRVLRLQPGAQIILLDGSGQESLVELVALDGQQAAGKVVAQQQGQAEPGIEVALLQCALKSDKFEWVLQKGTELGVGSFVPVISTRTVVRPAEALVKKYSRWRTILQEATEQCGRSRTPALLPPVEFEEALANTSTMRLVAWEGAAGRATTLAGHLNAGLAGMAPGSVALLVGPEGGLTAEEVAHAATAGWHVVSLGPRILRAETAALAAVATTMAILEAAVGRGHEG